MEKNGGEKMVADDSVIETEKTKSDDFDDFIANHFRLYEMILGIIKHDHQRWIDNFRIFLTFNSLFIPLITALLGYAIKESNPCLFWVFYLISMACAVGIAITYISTLKLQRINKFFDLRHKQARAIEALLPVEVKFYIGGHELSKNPKGKGIHAYKSSCWWIIVYYVFIGLTSSAIAIYYSYRADSLLHKCF
jgi:hypothetical protein